jgi:hypothetical protein
MSCGVTAVSVQIHVDHIKPRSSYPELELDIKNLQVLCRDCNLGKSNTCETDLRIGHSLKTAPSWFEVKEYKKLALKLVNRLKKKDKKKAKKRQGPKPMTKSQLIGMRMAREKAEIERRSRVAFAKEADQRARQKVKEMFNE